MHEADAMFAIFAPQTAAALFVVDRQFEDLAADLAGGEEVDAFRIERVLASAGRDMTALPAACDRHAEDLDRFEDDGGRVREAVA